MAAGDVDLGAPILGAYTSGENVSVPQKDGTRTSNGGDSFARPAGAKPATTNKKQGSAFEWDDAVEQNAITSSSGRTPTVGTTSDSSTEKLIEKKENV